MIKLLVTGCNGQLGREINKKYSYNKDICLINTDYEELDITRIEDVIDFVEKEKPYAIINCAAHTAVDRCEEDFENAFKINAIGPKNLAIAAEKVGAKLVQISTDYVFDGENEEAYKEYDIPNPKSVYGRTKLEGEKNVQQFCNRFYIIRTAWLYGEGKNFVMTMLKLAETKEEIEVVYDQIGSPTSTRVLANIIDSLIWTEKYGIYNGTCDGQCSWADFAKAIFEYMGKTTRVIEVTTKEYESKHPNSAHRPKFSVLDNFMLRMVNGYNVSDWKTEIEKYLSEMDK